MDSLCRHGRTREARDIFDSLAIKGQKTDVISYAILLHGYAREGCVAGMTNLFNLLLQSSIVPNNHVFSILIKACASHGLMDKAMLMFEEMRQHGLLPNEVIYVTVIHALCKVGRMDDAMDKFKKMLDQLGSPKVAVSQCLVLDFVLIGIF
jgi:pentatricopeptide repeat protein